MLTLNQCNMTVENDENVENVVNVLYLTLDMTKVFVSIVYVVFIRGIVVSIMEWMEVGWTEITVLS